MEFKSINTVRKYYFPRTYEKEHWDKMIPEEKGKHVVMETIELIKQCIYHTNHS